MSAVGQIPISAINSSSSTLPQLTIEVFYKSDAASATTISYDLPSPFNKVVMKWAGGNNSKTTIKATSGKATDSWTGKLYPGQTFSVTVSDKDVQITTG